MIFNLQATFVLGFVRISGTTQSNEGGEIYGQFTNALSLLHFERETRDN